MNRTLSALLALALTLATLGLSLAPALQNPDYEALAKSQLRTMELPPVFVSGKRVA